MMALATGRHFIEKYGLAFCAYGLHIISMHSILDQR